MNFGLVPDDSPLTYDQWRTLLGLPDVPEHIKVRARLRYLSTLATIRIVPSWHFQAFSAGLRRAMQAEHDAARDRILRDADLTLTVGRWTLEPELPAEPDTLTPQQRALPRPATSPPMWANNPTRSRRKR